MTTMTIVLRPATEADRAFLLRVYASTREEELRAVPWDPRVKEAFVAQQFNAQHDHYRSSYAGASWDVIEAEGRPAGRLYVARWPEEIRVIDIALLPEARGRGVGTMLLRGLLDEAGASGRKVSIHVERANPARRLYERLGFHVAADRGIYELMEWHPEKERS